LDLFTDKKVVPYLEMLTYKNLPKVVLAMDEIDKKCSSTDIANVLVKHRLRVSNSSLAQTLETGWSLGLIERNGGFSLTSLGKEWACKLERALQSIVKLEI